MIKSLIYLAKFSLKETMLSRLPTHKTKRKLIKILRHQIFQFRVVRQKMNINHGRRL